MSIKPFRMGKCNFVLPTVFDDALSYYEVLCKVVDTVNGVIDEVNEFYENVEEQIQEIIDNPYVLPQATASALGGVKADTKTSAETVEVKIDTASGKLYVPAGQQYTLPQATASALGGVKADTKTSEETVEVKIDSSTGKLYAPTYPSQYVLPQATENALGGIKASAKTSSETVEVKVDSATGKLYAPTYPSQYVLPQTTSQALGGIKAETKTSSETVEAKVDTSSGKLYVTAVPETFESFTIAPNSWTEIAGQLPYKYFTTVTPTYTVGQQTIVKLLNNNPALFANYGFAIDSISSNQLYIYSLEEPDTSVTLEVSFRG